MERASFVRIIIFVILISTACGSNSSKSSSSTTASTNKMATMTQVVELAVGTLRLEGTGQAVDKKLASQLLPYWQLIDELVASESTAPQEITAVVENIHAIMATEQVKAIQNMKLTQNDLDSAVQNAGLADSSGTTTKTNNIAKVSAGVGPSGGGPPDGGGGLIDGVSSGGGVISNGSTQQNTLTSQIFSSAGVTSLVEQVIKLLEKRISS